MDNSIKIEPTNQSGMDHSNVGEGILGLFMGIVSVIFVTAPHKIAAWVLAYTTWVNPEAKQFIMDISPFVGVLTGLTLFIVYLYKIKLYRRQIKEMDKKEGENK